MATENIFYDPSKRAGTYFAAQPASTPAPTVPVGSTTTAAVTPATNTTPSQTESTGLLTPSNTSASRTGSSATSGTPTNTTPTESTGLLAPESASSTRAGSGSTGGYVAPEDYPSAGQQPTSPTGTSGTRTATTGTPATPTGTPTANSSTTDPNRSTSQPAPSNGTPTEPRGGSGSTGGYVDPGAYPSAGQQPSATAGTSGGKPDPRTPGSSDPGSGVESPGGGPASREAPTGETSGTIDYETNTNNRFGYTNPNDYQYGQYYIPTREETVEGRMNSLLASNSDYLKAARAAGRQEGQSRGLLNSSMTAGAAELAAINSAMPIAQQDAGYMQSRGLAEQKGRIDTGLYGTQGDISSKLAAEATAQDLTKDKYNQYYGYRTDSKLMEEQAEIDKYNKYYDYLAASQLGKEQSEQTRSLEADKANYEAILEKEKAGYTLTRIELEKKKEYENAYGLASQKYIYDKDIEKLSQEAETDRNKARLDAEKSINNSNLAHEQKVEASSTLSTLSDNYASQLNALWATPDMPAEAKSKAAQDLYDNYMNSVNLAMAAYGLEVEWGDTGEPEAPGLTNWDDEHQGDGSWSSSVGNPNTNTNTPTSTSPTVPADGNPDDDDDPYNNGGDIYGGSGSPFGP